MASDDEDFRAGFYGEAFGRFEELGENSVARMLSSGEIVTKDREAALVWLGERERRSISAQARVVAAAETAAAAAVEQAKINARLANGTRNANRLATIAIIISVISVIVNIAIHSR